MRRLLRDVRHGAVGTPRLALGRELHGNSGRNLDAFEDLDGSTSATASPTCPAPSPSTGRSRRSCTAGSRRAARRQNSAPARMSRAARFPSSSPRASPDRRRTSRRAGIVAFRPYPPYAAYDCSEGGTSLFTDVAPTDPFCKHIHYIAAIDTWIADAMPVSTARTDVLTRLQMASFVANALFPNWRGHHHPWRTV